MTRGKSIDDAVERFGAPTRNTLETSLRLTSHVAHHAPFARKLFEPGRFQFIAEANRPAGTEPVQDLSLQPIYAHEEQLALRSAGGDRRPRPGNALPCDDSPAKPWPAERDDSIHDFTVTRVDNGSVYTKSAAVWVGPGLPQAIVKLRLRAMR